MVLERLSIMRFDKSEVRRANLCCGTQQIPDYLGIDFSGHVDLRLDLEKSDLPFDNNSLVLWLCN